PAGGGIICASGAAVTLGCVVGFCAREIATRERARTRAANRDIRNVGLAGKDAVVLSARSQDKFNDQNGDQGRRTQGCIVLAMLAVELKGKRTGSAPIRSQTWEQAWNVACVFIELWKLPTEEILFASNHRQIDKEEQRDEDGADDPAARGDGEPDCEDQRTQIKRVARVPVRAGGGQHFVFLYVAGSKGPQQQAR